MCRICGAAQERGRRRSEIAAQRSETAFAKADALRVARGRVIREARVAARNAHLTLSLIRAVNELDQLEASQKRQ